MNQLAASATVTRGRHGTEPFAHALVALGVTLCAGLTSSVVAFVLVGIVVVALMGGGCSAARPEVVCQQWAQEFLLFAPAVATLAIGVLAALAVVVTRRHPHHAWPVAVWVAIAVFTAAYATVLGLAVTGA